MGTTSSGSRVVRVAAILPVFQAVAHTGNVQEPLFTSQSRQYVPAGNSGTIAATGTSPHTATTYYWLFP